MLNAIPAVNLFGAANPLLEQSNLAKTPQEIRTHNFEQLSSRSTDAVKKEAKARSMKKEHSEDEDESEEDGEEPFPQQHNKPSIQERLNMAKQGKVSINHRAVTALFLQQAKSSNGTYKQGPGVQSIQDTPSIDVVA